MKVKVVTPGKPKQSDPVYNWKGERYLFRRRPDIEPVFGMPENLLSSKESVSINAMLAAIGWNLKKTMKDLAKKIEKVCLSCCESSTKALNINYRLLEDQLLRIE